MGLDVSGHVITKNFELVKKDLFDFLPYAFRFTFYYDVVEYTYKNAVGLYSDEVECKLEALGVSYRMGWTSLVKVSDVQLYLREQVSKDKDYVTTELFNMFMQLNPEDVLVVNGDQFYSNVGAKLNPSLSSYVEDDWFNHLW